MSASSRSPVSFTRSCAVRSAPGSMRMSSGASTAYEKPRSGRSSCIDETPRSRRIASARTPLSASCRSTVENSPWSSRVFAAVARRSRSKYGATVGSRSIAISFPFPRSRAASSAAWPPAPKVQSTTVSPGRGSSERTTSSARTGTWSVSVGKTLGNIFRAPFDLVHVRAPPGAIPDLEVVVDAGDRDLALDARALQQRGWQHHPSLLVQVGAHRAGEEVALHHPALPAERVERADAADQPLPLGHRVRVQAPVHPAGDDDAVAQPVAELRGEREAVLLVERMVVFAEQHGSTAPHFTPPLATSKPLRATAVRRMPGPGSRRSREPGSSPVRASTARLERLDRVAEPDDARLVHARVDAERQRLRRRQLAPVAAQRLQRVEVGPPRLRVLGGHRAPA